MSKIKREALLRTRKIESPLMHEIDDLSYRQLLRVTAVIGAKDFGEKKEAMNFVRNLTPPERKIVKRVETFDKQERQNIINVLNGNIQDINKREAKGIDGKALLSKIMVDDDQG